MKKPQYTRQTKPRVKRWQFTPKTWIEIYAKQLNDHLTQRDFLLSPSTTVEKEQIKNKKGLLVYKKQLNKEIKGHKKRIRFYKKKLSRQPKPLDIFEHASPRCSPEVISLVRDSPEVIEYLQKAYADIQSSPFKGLLRWYVADICQISIFTLEPDHLGQCNLRMHNKAWSYGRVLNRLFMQYPYRRFKPYK